MNTNTIVIGAGPAGLAVSVALSARGIQHVVLERGAEPLAALRRIDPAMSLVSPTPLARLPLMTELDDAPPYVTFAELTRAIERYRERHRIAVECGITVEAVEHTAQGFVVRSRDASGARREDRSRFVVSATGIIGAPRYPNPLAKDEMKIRSMHSLDVRREDLEASRRLLLVGGGTSARDVIDLWSEVRRTDDQAWLSLRSPLKSVPQRIAGVDVHYFVWFIEFVPARLWPVDRDLTIGRGLNRAIANGWLKPVSVIERWSPAIALADGTTIDPDLIVFATGFDYRVDHLGELVARRGSRYAVRACESESTPGLFLLGLRGGRTIASPFLRGIARDAEYVAKRIARES